MRQFSPQSVPESMIINKTDYTLTPIEIDPFLAFLTLDKTSKRMSMDTAGKSAEMKLINLPSLKVLAA